jgi:hypothetical protein
MTLLITQRIQGVESSLTVLKEKRFIKEFQRFFYLRKKKSLGSYVDMNFVESSYVVVLFWQDYTGEDVTVGNFFAAILGNKTALTGGSGKVVDSGPNDHIFIYYTDHGGPGVLG